MPDNETRRIQPLVGPYARRQIDVPKADADQAIADGWAIDPYGEPPPAREYDQERHEALVALAEKAHAKMRGDDKAVPEAKPEAKKRPPATEDRTVTPRADEPGTYKTRTPTASKPKE